MSMARCKSANPSAKILSINPFFPWKWLYIAMGATPARWATARTVKPSGPSCVKICKAAARTAPSTRCDDVRVVTTRTG